MIRQCFRLSETQRFEGCIKTARGGVGVDVIRVESQGCTRAGKEEGVRG